MLYIVTIHINITAKVCSVHLTGTFGGTNHKLNNQDHDELFTCNYLLLGDTSWRELPITQLVSRQLPTVVAQLRSWVRSSGICGGQSGTGANFLQVLQFPLPILILPTASYSLIILSSMPHSLHSGNAMK
jgi:hypothetical protein